MKTKVSFGRTGDITCFRLSWPGSINYLWSHYFHQMVPTQMRWLFTTLKQAGQILSNLVHCCTNRLTLFVARILSLYHLILWIKNPPKNLFKTEIDSVVSEFEATFPYQSHLSTQLTPLRGRCLALLPYEAIFLEFNSVHYFLLQSVRDTHVNFHAATYMWTECNKVHSAVRDSEDSHTASYSVTRWVGRSFELAHDNIAHICIHTGHYSHKTSICRCIV